MHSLREFIKIGEEIGSSDLEIITLYLTQDGMSEDAINIITDVLGKKMRQIEQKYASVKANMCYNNSYYYKLYGIETGGMLDTLTRIMMLDDEYNIEQIKWMMDFKIKPGPFWHDLAELIHAIQDSSYKPHFFNNYSKFNNVKNILEVINNEKNE